VESSDSYSRSAAQQVESAVADANRAGARIAGSRPVFRSVSSLYRAIIRAMPDAPKLSPRLPPRWVVVSAWVIHRAIHRLSGGRMGLWPPKPNRWGTMRLTTLGRRSGKKRSVILGYYEDGPNLVTMAMNGW
jgi:hypothetical protein